MYNIAIFVYYGKTRMHDKELVQQIKPKALESINDGTCWQ